MLKIERKKKEIIKIYKRRKTRKAFTYSQHLDVITPVLQIIAKILQSGLYLEVQREKGNISPLITINVNMGGFSFSRTRHTARSEKGEVQ